MSHYKLVLAILFILPFTAFPQHGTVSIEDCIEGAVAQGNFSKRIDNFQQVSSLIRDNQSSLNLPEFKLMGQYHYQSDVFAFPGEVPFSTPEIPNNQGRLFLGINQSIYNGKRALIQNNIQSIQNEVQGASVETEIQQVKESIVEIYFGVLKLQLSNEILEETISELNRELELVESLVENGLTDYKSVEKFQLQILELEQKKLTNNAEENILKNVLREWTSIDFEYKQLVNPGVYSYKEEVFSPQFKVLALKSQLLSENSNILKASRLPYLGLFAEIGIGSPNPYNFFITDPDLFYIAGLRFNWIIFDYGNTKRQIEMNSLANSNLKESEKFLTDNLTRGMNRHKLNIEKNQSLLKLDQTSIDLQKRILNKASNQYKNGFINSTEYLVEWNKLSRLQITQKLREVEIQESAYKISLITIQ